MSREAAYDTVQPIAINSFENNLNFKEELIKSEAITSVMPANEIEELFEDLSYFTKEAETILKRVGITK